MKKEVIFLSNGHAEDTISCFIIKSLLKIFPSLNSVSFKACPLVGEGHLYKKLGIEILGPCRSMPSDGFIAGNPLYFFKDLRAGWLSLYLGKIRALKKEKDKVRVVICVGDVFAVLTCLFSFLRKPVIFLPTAKSDYIGGHYFIEKLIMRKFCELVITRDEKTAISLKNYGINAAYLGNVMMDCLEVTGERFGIEDNAPVVGILPGSRKEAYENLKVILEAVRKIYLKDRKVKFFLSLAPSLDIEKTNLYLDKNWEKKDTGLEDKKKGVIACLISKEKAVVKVVRGRFGDVVNLSKVIIGTAGMANEQAIGLGKPVVAFPGKGPQITEKFLRIQRKLLGGCVFIVKRDSEAIAEKVFSLLQDFELLKKVARIGKERMGEPGAAERIARLIGERLTGGG